MTIIYVQFPVIGTMYARRRARLSRGSWNTAAPLFRGEDMPRKPLDSRRTERTFCHAVGVGSSMSKSRAVAAHAHPVCSVPDLLYLYSLFFKTVHSLQRHSIVLRVSSMQADPAVHQAYPVKDLQHMPSPSLSVQGFPSDVQPAWLQTVPPFSTC